MRNLMECLALRLRIEGAADKRLGPSTPFESVWESLMGKNIAAEEQDRDTVPPMLPFRIDLAVERTFVEVSDNRWIFYTERQGDHLEKSSWIRELMAKVQSGNLLNKDSISAVIVDTTWTFPFEGEWDDLFSQYARAFAAANALPSGTTDLSVLFDAESEGGSIHVQSGPMNREQLIRDWSHFPDPSEMPENLLFMVHNYRSRSDVDEALSIGVGQAEAESTRIGKIFVESKDEH